MSSLRLNFHDENGVRRIVSVNGNSFVVGRHSECDLSIVDSRLSREHLKIERFGDVFVASDLGSSNGSWLSGEKLSGAKSLRNGDVLDLGGVKIGVELESDARFNDGDFEDLKAKPAEEPVDAEALDELPAAQTSAAAPSRGISPLLVVPFVLLVICVLGVGGLLIYRSMSGGPEVANGSNPYGTTGDGDPLDPDPPTTPDDSGGPPATPFSSGTNGTDAQQTPSTGDTGGQLPNDPGGTTGTDGQTGGDLPASTPQPGDELAKIERSANLFLRRIAQNEPRAFITGEQSKIVSSRLKQTAGQGLADNINSARKSSAQLKSLAAAHSVRPQLLATAAIARLGNRRGDVLQTANSIADTIGKLGTQIGSERADDALLIIAAFDQGAAGDTMKMRNMLQALAQDAPESSRQIRSIWYLKKNSKITDAEYNNALNFLIIGTITQNPKDFNVNAEPLTL